jgi:hypothetical protein
VKAGWAETGQMAFDHGASSDAAGNELRPVRRKLPSPPQPARGRVDNADALPTSPPAQQ